MHKVSIRCDRRLVVLAGIAAVYAAVAFGQGTISTVTPGSVPVKSPDTSISIAGSNFPAAAIVSFTAPGGVKTALTPSQINAAKIAATIPAALLTSAGTAQIAIQNGSGVLSNQVPFIIGSVISVTAPKLADGTVGAAYSDALKATGGNSPYTWSMLSGALPGGLELASSGTISGAPRSAGVFSFGVQVTDISGAVASASASITVKPSALAINTGALPAGVVNFDYPQQVLEATGGSSPYSFSITGGTLPAGIALKNGVLSGIPTTSGTSSFTINVTDAAGSQTHVDTSINVRANVADLVLLSGKVSFQLATGATELPAAQTVGVQSATVAQALSYTVSTSFVPWISVTGGGVTPAPLSFSLTTAALSLSEGNYSTTVTLTCNSAVCAGKTQTVNVFLQVASPPPQLSVSDSLLSFATSLTKTQMQTVGIQNSGGGSLKINSVVCDDGEWCTVGSFPATVSPGAVVQVPITVNPATLSNGFFHSILHVRTSAGNVSVAVGCLIYSTARINLSQSGIQFNSRSGSLPATPSGSFLIAATGGTVSWSTVVFPAANWLTVSTGGGTASDNQPGTVQYTINNNAASLAAGTYYANIEVTAPSAVNAPLSYVIVLNVAATTQLPRVFVSPGGLVFITNAGTSPAPKTVTVSTDSSAPVSYQAAAFPETGSWLSVGAPGMTSATTPDQSVVSINTAGLAPGYYSGRVSYAIGSAGIRSVTVALIVVPAGVTIPQLSASDSISTAGPGQTPKATCSPTTLLPTQTGLTASFAAPASWPTPLAITLVNDCGSPVSNGQVVATFSNGDPPLALSLADGSTGLYSATWTPRNSSAQMTVTARATAPGLPAATMQIVGSVLPNSTPVLTPNGTVNPYNRQIGDPIAPGTIVEIYGSNLASGISQPTTIPLPTSSNGTSVLIGGVAAPLLYVSPGQINAQVPFELNSAKQYQVLAANNGALSTPQPIQLAPATPGLDAFPDGTLVAVHSATGVLVSSDAPAQAGEFIVMFLLGMGNTDNPVPTGAGSLSDPLSRPVVPPTLTLGGKNVPVAFAGLTPGFVGLYQINLQIPDHTPGGNLVLTVSQNDVVTNTTILPVF